MTSGLRVFYEHSGTSCGTLGLLYFCFLLCCACRVHQPGVHYYVFVFFWVVRVRRPRSRRRRLSSNISHLIIGTMRVVLFRVAQRLLLYDCRPRTQSMMHTCHMVVTSFFFVLFCPCTSSCLTAGMCRTSRPNFNVPQTYRGSHATRSY